MLKDPNMSEKQLTNLAKNRLEEVFEYISNNEEAQRDIIERDIQVKEAELYLMRDNCEIFENFVLQPAKRCFSNYEINKKLLKGNQEIFALKQANIEDPSAIKKLIHEYFVAAFGTNLLSQYIPNFAYVYALDRQQGKIYYEPELKPGHGYIALQQFVKNCDTAAFLAIFLEVLYSLHLANYLLKFTHYDLHYQNVQVKLGVTPKKIAYITENGTEYLKSTNLAKIVNFSQSHIALEITNTSEQPSENKENKTKSFGINNKLMYGVFPSRMYPLYDAYKLLLFCGYEAAQNNPPLTETIAKILTFFTDESLEHVLKSQREYFYYMPFIEKFSSMSLLDLTAFIRAEFPDIVKSIFINELNEKQDNQIEEYPIPFMIQDRGDLYEELLYYKEFKIAVPQRTRNRVEEFLCEKQEKQEIEKVEKKEEQREPKKTIYKYVCSNDEIWNSMAETREIFESLFEKEKKNVPENIEENKEEIPQENKEDIKKERIRNLYSTLV